jgi:hypothetical protein
LLHVTDMYALLNEVKKRRVTSLRFMIESLLPMTGHINSLDEWILITPLLALSEPGYLTLRFILLYTNRLHVFTTTLKGVDKNSHCLPWKPRLGCH